MRESIDAGGVLGVRRDKEEMLSILSYKISLLIYFK